MNEFVFEGLDTLVTVFGLGFVSGALIGFVSWTISKIVQAFKKFF